MITVPVATVKLGACLWRRLMASLHILTSTCLLVGGNPDQITDPDATGGCTDIS
jgi:hypothetical protein